MKIGVFVGYEPREIDGYNVTVKSMQNHNKDLLILPIEKGQCEKQGLYFRPTTVKDDKLFDIISNAPMATEFALTRFLVPWLSHSGLDWAIFMDCDMLVRCDLEKELAPLLNDEYAMMCVKHDIEHGNGIKMDNCKQTSYPRKNWSSVMAWNLKHPANDRLTVKMVNELPGKSLHQLCWLADHEIGELGPEWNHLVGLNEPNPDAKIVHYTLGIPSMPGYNGCEFSGEWWDIING